MLFKMMKTVTGLTPVGVTALDRFAASPLTCWWANYGLSLCAADDTVGVPADADRRCPVLRVVASLKVGG
jgi:hypothetical protein